MKNVLVFSVIGLCFCGCGQSHRNTALREYYERICAMVKDVNVADGVSQCEAMRLADAYYKRYCGSACGGLNLAVDRGDCWEIEAVVGIAAQHWGTIRVDKKTAAISCENRPTVQYPVKFFCSKLDN